MMPAQTQGQVTTENTLTRQGLRGVGVGGAVLESLPVWRVFHPHCVLYCVNSGSERAIVLGLFIHLVEFIQ